MKITPTTFASTAIILVAGVHCTIALLYPNSSVLQLTSSLSVPLLMKLPPMRHLDFDWGFQMNYDFPVKLSSFYNPTIWSRRQLQRRNLNANSTSNIENERHHNDFTAGELYAAWQRLLQYYGFDRSCLLLSVCELTQVPFEDETNLFSALLHYLLSPTAHVGFDETESSMRASFELAEQRGLADADCRCWYANCTVNPLDMFSKVH